jgi:hypothetical protein
MACAIKHRINRIPACLACDAAPLCPHDVLPECPRRRNLPRLVAFGMASAVWHAAPLARCAVLSNGNPDGASQEGKNCSQHFSFCQSFHPGGALVQLNNGTTQGLRDGPRKNVLVPRFFLTFSSLDVPFLNMRP